MKPTFKTRMMAMLPKNDYKFREYSVEVHQHNGRQMKPAEIDFISSVQRLPLEGIAEVLCLWESQENKLELVKIAMLFHIYRNDFDAYLKNNRSNPKVKRAFEIWGRIKSNQTRSFKA
ncbi:MULTISPECIES: hypothetical protein [unclassified Acinetobacter]|uniref:hypothetical protein n=1 Tax=unclassified Acinetobacter TaxID=196816 RepID=UPI0015D420CE|nr:MULTISPECIES: hypothetical protein [unclassified Acinetobacter]